MRSPREGCLPVLAAGVLLLVSPFPLLAAPLHGEHGAVSAGLAGSGTARAQGPEAVVANPAGMAWLTGVDVQVGGAVVLPYAQARSTTQTVQVQPNLLTPPAVFAAARSGAWSLGVGVYAPLLRGVSWPAPLRTRQDDKVLAVNPAVAWRLGPLALGAGVSVAGGYREAREPEDVLGQRADVRRRGLGTGGGANAGLRLEAIPQVLALGFHARSRLHLAFLEDVTGVGRCAPGTPCLRDGRAVTEEDLPDLLAAGLEAVPVPGTRVTLDATLAEWPAVEGAVTRVQDRRAGTWRAPSGFQAAPGLRAGVEQGLFFLAPDVKARAGVLWEAAPAPQVQAAQPWGDRVGGSVGLGWRFFGVAMDVAYVGDVTLPTRGPVPGGTATYWSTTHQLAVSVGYRHVPP